MTRVRSYGLFSAFFAALSALILTLPFSRALAEVRGIADMHAHPFANEGFGGLFFQGKTYSEGGLPVAMATCEHDHGFNGLKDLIGNAASGRLSHSTKAYPSFEGWPAWNNLNHQQVYYKWLERAHRGGLQLIVAHAVNSDALCSLMKTKEGYGCNDMQAVDRQIEAAHGLVSYIDREAGGEGKGWLAIVRSAAEARSAIRSGKLAMVLGIEVDSLFNCKVGTCDERSVRADLDRYYAKGVRHIIPVHVTDNAFGGAAMFNPLLFNYANRTTNGNFFAAYDCSDEGYTYKESLGKNPAFASGGIIPNYPAFGAFCNARGLSPLGEFLIEQMMQKHMIIDIDHMGAKTANAALTLAESYQYPLASGHTGFIATSAEGQKRSEAQKTDLQLRRLMRLGGVVGPILQQGNAESEVLPSGSITNDCDRSSKSFLQAFTYAKGVAEEEMANPAVGYGSDFNGLIEMPAPRFGKDACGKNAKQAALQGHAVSYPFRSALVDKTFDRQVAGTRAFDINTDGFTQIGMLPDFIQDLMNTGMSEEDLKPLFRSAEAYLEMWEKAEAYLPLPRASQAQ